MGAAEAAVKRGISDTTVRLWAMSGRVGVVRLGNKKKIYVNFSDIERIKGE